MTLRVLSGPLAAARAGREGIEGLEHFRGSPQPVPFVVRELDENTSIHERLVLYKRLANCETADELEAQQEELVDRFG